MDFLHGYLLAGLVLAGLPILIHLAMRQKPRRLAFPAFRFLKLRHHINRRRLRLQHLLLLLLRIGLIAALCFALARPRVETAALPWNADQPVAVVLLFDTSPSMEYQAGGASRLEEARKHALGLLDQMADNSRVVILDAGDDAETKGDAASAPNQTRTRIKGLAPRPFNSTMNAQLPRAYRALDKLATTDPNLPRLLYVFSDRTTASWSADRKIGDAPKDVRSFYVDVGIDEPHDLAIEQLDVDPIVAEPGQRIDVRIAVRATGGDKWRPHSLLWAVDNDPNPEQVFRRQVELSGGKTEVLAFEYLAPKLPTDGARVAAFQITAKLEPADQLAFNNTRTATFLVRPRRSVLTIADRPEAAFFWSAVFKSVAADRPPHETFRCEVEPTKTVEDGWRPDSGKPDPLENYSIVCLFQTAKPSSILWGRIKRFVERGGHLVIVPGGDEMAESLKTFNDEGQSVLPAQLIKIVDAKKPVRLEGFSDKHPLTKPFVEWEKDVKPDFARKGGHPFFNRYWEIQSIDKNPLDVILHYEDRDEQGRLRPALVEREIGRGRVILFTTPLEPKWSVKKDDATWEVNNIWSGSSFGIVLVDQVCRYLTGEMSADDLNFECGRPVAVPLLNRVGEKEYQLKGPVGLTLSETKVPAPGDGRRLLTVPQATHAGNYTLIGEGERIAAAFSLTIPPEESRLERVPVEMIETTLGEGALLSSGKTPTLQDAITERQTGKQEFLPWLLLLVLLVLAVESVLANKFYKRETVPAEEIEASKRAASATPDASLAGKT